METVKKGCIFCAVLITLMGCKNKDMNKSGDEVAVIDSMRYREAYRPQFHFSPEEKWMNDPNGLVYYDGTYHLFYQYYPGDIVWGPMHWGHAVSKDMVYWEHRPIALFPDEHGLIFSGSAVVDYENTSGFGTADKPPMVAIFTYHNMEGEQEGRSDFQTQGIAYSLDKGATWTKYQDNPVIGNEAGIRDFRDPKVFWHADSSSWIMVLVAGDHAKFYRSENLREWEYLSDFGKDVGAHGGVWECPDLFAMKDEETGEEKWVLLISINPGAPNGGSGTQYFIGNFNGTQFTSNQKDTRWLDWGTDNYAGVTYNNLPDEERLFIGWMSNWDYARDTPTENWRSAMTLPRNLRLLKKGDRFIVASSPVENFGTILKREVQESVQLASEASKTITFDNLNQAEVRFSTSGDFVLKFKNSLEEELVLTLDSDKNLFLLDRVASGKTAFKENFADKIQQMPVADLGDAPATFRILMDWSSIEVFINDGEYVMTAQLFPNEPYTELEIRNPSEEDLDIPDLEISRAETIW
ncbi:glycoside hydrolase family 32 protein [Flavobacteriaceae bacterium R33]|uniref:Glycoside hydrolase family 32 protein n=2 Tax=Poritiphilus flavus TaxID=2697053 RepID=A0A6L9EDM9_9FLAO|nr:glycoside hydrolase family 32 protein [Poritiphilus flavus]